MYILLTLQIIIGIFLILAILMEKSTTDGLSGLSSNSMKHTPSYTGAAMKFLTKVIISLAILFLANALLLANLCSQSNNLKEQISNLTKQEIIKEEKSNINIAN